MSQHRGGLEGQVLLSFSVVFDPQVNSPFLTLVVHVTVCANAHLMTVVQKGNRGGL